MVKQKFNFMIGVGGGSGSGKTTFVKALSEHFHSSNITTISLDNYYKDNSKIPMSQRKLLNYDHPKSIDFKTLHKHLLKIRNNNSIKMPLYDFKKHVRRKTCLEVVPKKNSCC